MSSDKRWRAGWIAAASIGLCSWACQSILGIEDLNEGPRDGGIGAGGTSGGGGSGGMTGSLGGSTNQSGAGGSSEGGVGGLALSDAGTDATGPASPITISGRVIDFFRHPVPGVPVTIGAREVLTDDDGAFTIADVTPPYDVSLIAATTVSAFTSRYYAYVYQGLTRPDPTVQVYYGLPERGASLDLTITNAELTDPNQMLIFAFASPDGHYAASGISDAAPLPLSLSWSGTGATAGNAHALLVLRASSSASTPPVAYQAYQTAPLALNDEAESNISFDMTAQTISQVTLTGSVEAGNFGSQTHLISTRTVDGTVVPLLAQESTQGTFSYLVPALPDASLIVAASASMPGSVVAHADGILPIPDQNVALTLPRPVTPSAPPSMSEVGPGTVFSWSTLGQTAGVFVWHLESDGYFEGIYVITSRDSIEYPQVPGYSMVLPTLQNDFIFYWSVETHGDYASVDAAAGPEGLYDSFALERNMGTGPSRGSRGYFTNSDVRVVDVTAQ